MDAPLPSPRLAHKASSIPVALTPVLKTLGLEEEDPEEVFEIHSKEGAGAFGRVFRASYRCDPSKLAALKVIPVALEAGQRGEDIANVRREIEFLRECDHPNVVAFFGAYYKDQALWVAMEYCGGGSVGDVSRRRHLDEQEIAVITRGALQGLAYLHSRKKIHRDIKGGNILLTSHGEVKIADFGVSAQLKDTMSRRGTFVGTPYWMSPEMIQDSDYDYKSDIWSLGITLIELADQRPPLFDEHPMRVLIQIPRNPPPSVKNPLAWSPLLIQFLQFCLRKDPKERPSAAECLDHAFIQRVADVRFVYAEGVVARRAAQDTEASQGDHDNERGTSIGSLTVNSPTGMGESDALADDVTLKASAAQPPRPPGKTPQDQTAPLTNELLGRRRSIRLTEPGTPSESGGGDIGTPRGSESVAEENWDGTQSAALTSSRSSRSDEDDHTTDGNDAVAEGFAFRSTPPPTQTDPPAPTPCLEMVSGDELMQLSIDDSFEMPATTLISRIHAAASTLAGRPRPTPVPQQPPLGVPLHAAPSPVVRERQVGRTLPTHEPRPAEAPSTAPARRDLSSFSRTDMAGRRGLAASKTADSPLLDTAEAGDRWRNPLTELMAPSHDRVNSLLSSISSSTTHLAAQRHEVSRSVQLTNSLRGSSNAPLQPAASFERSGSVASASKHFIGTPFRVSHQLNVRYNTVDAKFEGVPSDWESVHKQFGIPLAQMRGRSNASDCVPALVQMLRRELVKRDGLDCKYIYRVSPDQSEVQHVKQAINNGTFEPTSVSDPHVFASLIKHWLRELPTALLSAITRSDLAAAVERLVKGGATADSSADPELAMGYSETHAYVTASVLAKLPTAECSLLLWLVDHMIEVVAKSDSNGMSAHSLAVVMAPNVYRWASTTPTDASVISKQVAMLLRVLVTWRQRSRNGVAAAVGERGLSSSITVRTQSASEFSSISERADVRSSLALRSSASAPSTPGDLTLSSIFRSSTSGGKSTHFVSASTDVVSETEAAREPTNAPSLDSRLRDCVDKLWNELPLSILLDDQPPIVRSLFAKFQKQVFSLIAQLGNHGEDKKWAKQALQRISVDPKAAPTAIPVSLRMYKRWISAALTLESFLTLLKHQRRARTLLDKHRGPTARPASQDFTSKQAFLMNRIITLGLSSNIYGTDPTADVQDAMLDGASAYLSILREAKTSRSPGTGLELPHADDLVCSGLEDPLLGNLLVGLSGGLTGRYHLQKLHAQLAAKVRQIVAKEV